ncbi:dCTP deaminase [Methanoplanus sp. FWC-SCC4]|uniref:dCTP deaminase n=1 Tax=Methanochimaera problematica TaxID=2609417 RepID=A0AA97I4P4_9EURY|nr:dCTP deaminase [Methanoplanus sp. FWC-SCC4]WOF16576.1 dCTP deaminase [Methanoplanus sp. FWC-SCC4]
MILSKEEMEKRIESGSLILNPYSNDSQQPASYDLRSGEDYILRKGETTLVHSMERVELPVDVSATLMCRSSFGRRGVLIGGGYVDPGFRGNLTLCLVNMGAEDIELKKGERCVQIIMHEVTGGKTLYNGRYQDSEGAVGARN